MYYERDNSEDRNKFKESCENRALAKELLDKNKDLGEKDEKREISTDGILDSQEISITRIISFGENENQATIVYEAEKDSKVIATVKTTLVPNAVHWCS